MPENEKQQEPELTLDDQAPDEQEDANDLFNKFLEEDKEEQAEASQPDKEHKEAPSGFKFNDDGKLVIGDKEYTYEEAQSSLMRQADYTRKTQELAREREAYQSYAYIDNILSKLPQDFTVGLVNQVKDAGIKAGIIEGQLQEPSTTSVSDKLKDLGYDDDLVSVFRQMEAQNANLQNQIKAITEPLKDVQGFVKDVRGDQEAKIAASEIKSKYGVDVEPVALRQVQKDTGISDLEAAWLKSNASTIFAQRSTPAEKPKPPIAPTTEGQVFIIGSKTTESEIMNAAMQGMVIKTEKELGK